MPDPTPSMQQYLKAKADHPDCIVLFRMGDFYETFFDDAVEAASILDIALTSRNKDDPDPIPMAGVPHHSVNRYIARLLQAGKRVAICDQVEDPRKAKGLVRREVVRVVTPGVLLDTEMEDAHGPNHLVCVVPGERGWGVAVMDASTGSFKGALVTDREVLDRLIARIGPREALFPSPVQEDEASGLAGGEGVLITRLAQGDEDPARLDGHAAGLVPPEPAPHELRAAAAGVVAYLGRTHAALLRTLRAMRPLAVTGTMILPRNTIRNLDLLRSTATGRPAGSLLHYMDRTRTPMGSRLLRWRLLEPLTDVDGIERRFDQVQALVEEVAARNAVREALKGVGDVERVLTRLAAGACSARDLNAVAGAIEAMQRIADEVGRTGRRELDAMCRLRQELPPLAAGIRATFVEDPPAGINEGGMVKAGVDPELDEALDTARHGKRYIAEYEAAERTRTGIPTLKVRYNRVFGYTIEVTKAHLQRVPEEYHRRQTLANAERYTTQELRDLETRVETAQERARVLEQEIFERFRTRVLDATEPIQEMADAMAVADVTAALAELAHSNDLCRPVVDETRVVSIVQGRHPIVEDALPPGSFVPNDYEMDGETVTLDVITGPNMAGKSTVMRQVALMVIMAQAGSFIPAGSARFGVVDAVFTRVGAMDDLAAGRSTFMVEMAETAEILSRATDRSLVVLDEIGRGTSTFDGVAIAWAVAEYIQQRIGCRTMFATHYHELTELVRVLPRTRNLSVAVKEWGGEILFLRKLVDGPASKSYGIQVARLAGLPDGVLARAREVLANLESSELDLTGRPVLARTRSRAAAMGRGAQLDMFGRNEEPVVDPVVSKLATIEVERLTPVEAIQVLSSLVDDARGRKGLGHGRKKGR